MAHRLSTEAELELDDIWWYIARESGSADIAERFIAELTQNFYLIASHPFIGRSRDEDLRSGLHSFPVGTYVILYVIDDADVLITHVISRSRDIERFLAQQWQRQHFRLVFAYRTVPPAIKLQTEQDSAS